jgi:hypothetical protein
MRFLPAAALVVSGVIVGIVIPSGIVPAVLKAVVGRPGPWWGSFKEEVRGLSCPYCWLLICIYFYPACTEFKECVRYGKHSAVFNVRHT